jgi:hypothetical protein
MGVEFPIPATFSVCQLTRDHGAGAGHRLPFHRHADDHKAGYTQKSARIGAVTLIHRFGANFSINGVAAHIPVKQSHPTPQVRVLYCA